MTIGRTKSQDMTDLRVDSVVADVAAAFCMDEEEARRFSRKWITRLIAALPFAAGARNPERTAALHLSTYVLSVRQTRHLFFAAPEHDCDVFARLEPIARFDGGNQAIIQRGLAHLALTMVTDYRRDVELDKGIGKYNPVAAGVWDSDAVVGQLESIIKKTESPELDRIVYGDGAGTDNFWTW